MDMWEILNYVGMQGRKFKGLLLRVSDLGGFLKTSRHPQGSYGYVMGTEGLGTFQKV